MMMRFFRDRQFIAAFAIAPVVWLALVWLQRAGSPSHFNLDYKLIAYTGLIYPLLEELAFRGAIQGWLLDTTLGARKLLATPGPAGLTMANVLTSLLFAAAHLLNQPPMWAMLIFFPSLVFGYFRDRTDSVIPSVVLHSWYNLGFVILVTA